MENKTLREKLLAVQTELKAPKGQLNKFGGFRYRSCEDILEAVKPLLEKHGLLLTIKDKVSFIGERYYIKATAYIEDGTGTITSEAYAREEETKKGMDGSQITGASSSYARKYALNALFLIDDTVDSDYEPQAEKENKSGLAITRIKEKITKAATQRELEKIVSSIKKAKENNILGGSDLAEVTTLYTSRLAEFKNGETN